MPIFFFLISYNLWYNLSDTVKYNYNFFYGGIIWDFLDYLKRKKANQKNIN
jgi:hypothetical protein